MKSPAYLYFFLKRIRWHASLLWESLDLSFNLTRKSTLAAVIRSPFPFTQQFFLESQVIDKLWARNVGECALLVSQQSRSKVYNRKFSILNPSSRLSLSRSLVSFWLWYQAQYIEMCSNVANLEQGWHTTTTAHRHMNERDVRYSCP